VAPDRPIPSPTLPLPLLPSGPDGVYGLVARGDRRGPPARIVAKNPPRGWPNCWPKTDAHRYNCRFASLASALQHRSRCQETPGGPV